MNAVFVNGTWIHHVSECADSAEQHTYIMVVQARARRRDAVDAADARNDRVCTTVEAAERADRRVAGLHSELSYARRERRYLCGAPRRAAELARQHRRADRRLARRVCAAAIEAAR